jgi:hypothetical protein
MHKILKGEELMYTFTAGLHMMSYEFYYVQDMHAMFYMYMYPNVFWSICIHLQLYNDLNCFMNVLFTSSATLSLINEIIIFL